MVNVKNTRGSKTRAFLDRRKEKHSDAVKEVKNLTSEDIETRPLAQRFKRSTYYSRHTVAGQFFENQIYMYFSKQMRDGTGVVASFPCESPVSHTASLLDFAHLR